MRENEKQMSYAEKYPYNQQNNNGTPTGETGGYAGKFNNSCVTQQHEIFTLFSCRFLYIIYN